MKHRMNFHWNGSSLYPEFIARRRDMIFTIACYRGEGWEAFVWDKIAAEGGKIHFDYLDSFKAARDICERYWLKWGNNV